MSTPQKTKKKLNDLQAQLDRLGYGKGGPMESRVFSADELRKKLAKGKPRQGPQRTEKAPPVTQPSLIYRRGLPATSPQTWRRPSIPTETILLEDHVPGTVMEGDDGSAFYLVTRDIDTIEGAEALSDHFRDCLKKEYSPIHQRLCRAFPETDLTYQDVIFMDIETTGLGSSPLFLIGIMVWADSGLQVRQFLARHYGEEKGTVTQFIRECAARKLLVTFNGKSFDMPYIRTRSAAIALPFNLAPCHFDLLHESRRVWKGLLPNCKLQTLERHICGRTRHGDIPGSEIPEAYHAFVRTGNAWQIVEILKHNMLDLVTLADLMTRFPDEC